MCLYRPPQNAKETEKRVGKLQILLLKETNPEAWRAVLLGYLAKFGLSKKEFGIV